MSLCVCVWQCRWYIWYIPKELQLKESMHWINQRYKLTVLRNLKFTIWCLTLCQHLKCMWSNFCFHLFLADFRPPSCWSVLLWGWRYVWFPWLWCQVIWGLCGESEGFYFKELSETLCPASGPGWEGWYLNSALHDPVYVRYICT